MSANKRKKGVNMPHMSVGNTHMHANMSASNTDKVDMNEVMRKMATRMHSTKSHGDNKRK